MKRDSTIYDALKNGNELVVDAEQEIEIKALGDTPHLKMV
jgi:hypothetical protein